MLIAGKKEKRKEKESEKEKINTYWLYSERMIMSLHSENGYCDVNVKNVIKRVRPWTLMPQSNT